MKIIMREKEREFNTLHIGKKAFTLDNDYITNTINLNVTELKPYEPIYLAAQTGAGKTTYFAKELIPLFVKNYKNVLVLTNRKATDIAFKIALCNSLKEHKILQNHTIEGLSDDVFQIGEYVTVKTYQKLIEETKNNTKNVIPYDVIIMDEAHFFTSDATFNARTEQLLKYIIYNYYTAIRFYISATPEFCFDNIHNYECKSLFNICKKSIPMLCRHIQNDCDFLNACTIGPQISSNRCLSINKSYTERDINELIPYKFYTTYRDYSYIIPHIFEDEDEYIIKIKESADKNKKSIIFVNSKENGKSLGTKIGKDIAVYVDRNSRFNKDTDEGLIAYKEILENETFSKKVLITTSVIDNGISINDKTVENIVILTHDRTQYMQMLGRVRIKNNQKINLYICNYPLAHFSSSLNMINAIINDVNKFKEDESKNKYLSAQYIYDNYNINLEIRKMIYHDYGNELIINNLGIKKLYNDRNYLDNIIPKFKNNEINVFPKEVLSWLDILETDCFLSSKKQKIDNLRNFLLTKTGIVISDEEEIKKITYEIYKCYDRPKKYDITRYKKLLKDIHDQLLEEININIEFSDIKVTDETNKNRKILNINIIDTQNLNKDKIEE